MKNYKICVIKGDGIGPEIIDEAIKVLDVVSAEFGIKFEYDYKLMGGAAYDVFVAPLPDETLSSAFWSDWRREMGQPAKTPKTREWAFKDQKRARGIRKFTPSHHLRRAS